MLGIEPLELCLAFFARSSKAQGLSGGCLADPRGDLDLTPTTNCQGGGVSLTSAATSFADQAIVRYKISEPRSMDFGAWGLGRALARIHYHNSVDNTSMMTVRICTDGLDSWPSTAAVHRATLPQSHMRHNDTIGRLTARASFSARIVDRRIESSPMPARGIIMACRSARPGMSRQIRWWRIEFGSWAAVGPQPKVNHGTLPQGGSKQGRVGRVRRVCCVLRRETQPSTNRTVT